MRIVGQILLAGVVVSACGQAPKETPTQTQTPKKNEPNLTTNKPTPQPTKQPKITAEPVNTKVETSSPEITISLRAMDIPSQDEIALSKIIAKVTEQGKQPIVRELGEYPGCSNGEPSDNKALSSIRCFWAGGEDTFELFQEEDALIVRHSTIGNDEDTPGKPEEELRVALVKDAKVKVSHPGDHLEISPDHVGAYKLTMTSKEASLLPNASTTDEVISFEDDGVELSLRNGAVCSIAIYSQGPKTKEGLGIGSTISDFQKQYGPAKWDNYFSALVFEKEPRLRAVVSYEELSKDHKLPQPEAKVTNILVGDCEASELK